MKLPANYADVRMEQLLQRTQTLCRMVKDEELKLMIIGALLYAINAIVLSIKEKKCLEKKEKQLGKKHIEKQSDGSSTMTASEWSDIPIEDRLLSWAQNDEMVDRGYTQKGRDLLEAAEWIKLGRGLTAD